MTPPPVLPQARALVALVSAMGLIGAVVLTSALWVAATSPRALGPYLLLVVVMTLLTDVTAIDLRWAVTLSPSPGPSSASFSGSRCFRWSTCC